MEQLLESRDARAAHQQELLAAHPSASLVCLTVQLPGPEKRNALSLTIGQAGLEALRERFPASHYEVRDLETGYEVYMLVREGALEAKRMCCELEESHPLGRLMDMDVLGAEGPVSRSRLGLPERCCLLCGQPVRYCMRAKNHSREELLLRIKQMVEEYEKRM